MKKLWCLVVLLVVFVVSDAMAANVYLKDGSVVQCQSFWRSKSTVFVKVNRDVLLEFAQGDVNIRKTFRARSVKKTKRVKVREGQLEKAEPAVNSTPATGTTKPAPVTTKPAPVTGKPALVTTVSPKTGNAPAGGSVGTTAVTTAANHAPTVNTPSTPAQTGLSSSTTNVGSVQQPPQPVTNPVVPAPSAVSQAAGMGFGMTALLVPLLLVIIMLASMWRVFEKAGEAGWKSIIPIYNLYVLILIAGKPGWWFLIIAFVPLIGLIFYLLACLSLAQKFDKGPLYGVLLCFFGFIMFPLLAFDNSTYTP
ncbi:MAG: hypothetical protein CXR31_06230 [Geobacter sp.]|nr:MAG: hypothetical protein CXR31_06230 [Geobacter sp.]